MVFVVQGLVGRDALAAGCDAVVEAEAFAHDGREVGEGFELCEGGQVVGCGVGAWGEGGQFGAETLEFGRVGEEVVGYEGEDFGGCFACGDEEDVAFVCETGEGLFGWGEFGAVAEFFEDGWIARGGGFGVYAGVGEDLLDLASDALG